MVPPQPRFPLRRPCRAGWVFGVTVATLAALLVAALSPLLLAPLKEAMDRLRGYPAWHSRAALGPEAPPFGGLAASQVGYGPYMLKQFSSPRRFASFQVVSGNGEVAFQGGPRSSGCYRLRPISRPEKTIPASPSPGTACPTCWTRRGGGWSGYCLSSSRAEASKTQPARSATGRMAPTGRSACRPTAPARWAPSPPAARSGR
jgi:hypothetical protein